jgi:hypothetical protein
MTQFRREEQTMEGLWSAQMWGTPVGLGIVTFLVGSGLGVFFWGVSKLPRKKE